MNVKCHYNACTFEGTQEQVDEHIAYLQGIGDEEHLAQWKHEGYADHKVNLDPMPAAAWKDGPTSVRVCLDCGERVVRT